MSPGIEILNDDFRTALEVFEISAAFWALRLGSVVGLLWACAAGDLYGKTMSRSSMSRLARK